MVFAYLIMVFLVPLPLATILGVAYSAMTWRMAQVRHLEWRRTQRARAGMLVREVEVYARAG